MQGGGKGATSRACELVFVSQSDLRVLIRCLCRGMSLELRGKIFYLAFP